MNVTIDQNIVTCSCGVWHLDISNLDHYDVILFIAQHGILNHDYEYSDIVSWMQANWFDITSPMC